MTDSAPYQSEIIVKTDEKAWACVTKVLVTTVFWMPAKTQEEARRKALQTINSHRFYEHPLGVVTHEENDIQSITVDAFSDKYM